MRTAFWWLLNDKDYYLHHFLRLEKIRFHVQQDNIVFVWDIVSKRRRSRRQVFDDIVFLPTDVQITHYCLTRYQLHKNVQPFVECVLGSITFLAEKKYFLLFFSPKYFWHCFEFNVMYNNLWTRNETNTNVNAKMLCLAQCRQKKSLCNNTHNAWIFLIPHQKYVPPRWHNSCLLGFFHYVFSKLRKWITNG